MKTWFLWILFMCSLSASALPIGDVNGDGTVDVADLVRAKKMAEGALAFNATADIDGDSAITAIDIWLIQEAVLGRPISRRVDEKRVGSSGGTLSDSNLTVHIAAGLPSPSSMALFRCQDESPAEFPSLRMTYMLTGISSNSTEIQATFPAIGTNNALCIAYQSLPYDGAENKWRWFVLPDTKLIRNGSSISVALTNSFVYAGDMTPSRGIKFALGSFDSPAPLPASLFLSNPSATEGIAPFSVPGRKYAGYTHTGWLNDHFHVYTKDWGSVSYSQLETVCGYLEDVYTKLKTIIGFPLDTSDSSLFPVEVYVSKGIKEEGYMMSIPGMTPYLVINAKSVISGDPIEINELRATIGHEMMHRALSRYNNGDSFAFGAMEDGITTWFERIANDKPDHLSSNYKVRTATPLKSLFTAQGWWKSWKKVEQQGYAVSAFVDYNFSNGNESQIYALAQQVKSGKNIREALDTVFTTMHGSSLYDTERMYLEFARDYLMTTNCYSSDLTSDAIFTSDSETDLKPFYKKITIRKASSNLWEKQEVDFTVQDYGCGILQLFVIKPDNIFAPHTKLKVSVPKICNSMDIVMTYKDDKKHTEITKGQFVTDSEGNKSWTCSAELPPDAKYIRLFAMTTMGNAGSISYTDKHPIKMSYQFEGDLYIPPNEAYLCYNSLREDTLHTKYYRNHILANASFRMVDPTGIEGLTNFKISRTIESAKQPSNIAVSWAYSSAVASRLDTGAFQLRIFSDAKVTDPKPFTIWFDTDDNPPAAWNHDYDVKMAPDGTPQMRLMVYHYPKGTELTVGQDQYRIDNRLVSAGDLQQSEDGLSGGVLVDVPSQTADYYCGIILESISWDNIHAEEAPWSFIYFTITPQK